MALSTGGDAEARGILIGDAQAVCVGLVVVLLLLSANALFVTGVDPMAAVCCFHFVRYHCVVPLVMLRMEKVLGE